MHRQMCLQLGKLALPAKLPWGPGRTRFLSRSVCVALSLLCASPAPLSRSVRGGGAAEGRLGRERLPDGVLDRALLLLPLGHADLTPPLCRLPTPVPTSSVTVINALLAQPRVPVCPS